MNKAITDGLQLMPPAFIDGLDQWSSGDGTPGTTGYDTDPNGTLVASDPDFGACLEVVKADTPQRIRHKGETPILPGCYLEVTARIKLMSGPFPQVQVSAFAGDAGGVQVTGVPETGPLVDVDQIGRIYTVRAIIGTGVRTGVDMIWGTSPIFAHVGLDIVGDAGAILRVESISVEDKTSVFHRKMMDWVDVRDFGAVGDGVTDDATAFETADANAAGRVVVVSAGTYRLDRDITLLSPVRFEGTITQPGNHRFILRSNFDYPSYVEAFGDETLALKKALQALFNFADHESLDLGGRRIQLTEPIDVAAAVGNVTSYYSRRAIRNGQFAAQDNANFDDVVETSTASYSTANALVLSNVTNIENIPVGALVEGFGVGREVYVRGVNVPAQEITLSKGLSNAQGSQSYTFTRFQYMLDFSGFERINSFNIEAVEFLGNRRGSGILLPDEGIWWTIRNCWFTEVAARGITSIGSACQGISIDQCEFIAPDDDLPTQDRTSVGFNVNNNDAKIRHNRCIEFRHFGILGGSGNLVLGNHFWQIDSAPEGQRTAGLIIAQRESKTTITGNYIDNHFIEFSNEYQAGGVSSSGQEFGNVSITGNVFTATQVPSWYNFIVLAPKGTGHRLDGVSVTGNVFKLFGGAQIERVDGVDLSDGSFDLSQTTDLVFDANAYDSIDVRTQSPALIEVSQGSDAAAWTVDASDKLPFGAYALGVDAVVPHDQITAGGSGFGEVPWADTRQGAGQNQVTLRWRQAASGTVQVRVRADLPGGTA